MKKLTYILFFSVLLVGCGNPYQKSPVDQLIVSLDNEPTYTIILFDMDVDGGFSNTYKHKYKIITEVNGEPREQKTSWYNTSKEFFLRNQNNLGMELASKTKDGKINKVPSPPGYGNYVGNDQYGHWVNRNGSSFWEFYGKYAMLSTIFNMGRSPIYYNNYRDYSGNYRGSRPYYGPRSGGTYKYGTNSAHTRASSPNFFQRRQQSTGWKSSSARSTSSSYRSRSSSFGK